MRNTSSDKKKKKKVIGLVFALILVSTIGVGFALTYQGETSVMDNTSDAKHIVLTLGDNSADDYSSKFTNPVVYDTYTDASGTTWIPQYDTDSDNDSVDDCVILGTVTINVTETHTDDYYIAMSKIGTMTAADFMVGVKVNSGTENFIDFDSNEFDITGTLNGDKTVTVSLYYKATSVTTEPVHILDSVDFKFIAYAVN